MNWRDRGKLPGLSSAQAMVEFVIILPVMLTLILAIIQFGLVYKAKITLNYATFQAARAGTLNNASLEDMQLAFAGNMAPLYTTSYLNMDSSNNCSSSFSASDAARQSRVGTSKITQDAAGLRGVLDANINNFDSGRVLCARRVVQQQIADGYVQLSVVNPGVSTFSNFGVSASHDIDDKGTMRTVTMIPNDNLMYRDPTVVTSGGIGQSIQDANLLKIHVGYCYELIIPFINRMVWAMQRYGPGNAPAAERRVGRYWADPASTPPGFFGPPTDPFAQSCIINPADAGRRSIVLYSQAIMRMQSPAVQCEISNSC